MPNVPQRRKLTDALKSLLENSTGRSVGVGSAPVDINGVQEDLPYLVVYPIPSGSFTGPILCAPNADAIFEYQINSYGRRYDQVEWLADLVRVTLVDRDSSGALVNRLSYDGHSVMDQMLLGPPGKLDEVGQIWSVMESYAIAVTSQA